MNEHDAPDPPPRSGPADTDDGRWLLRSARLDAPSPERRRRAIEQVLSRRSAGRAQLLPQQWHKQWPAAALALSAIVVLSLGAASWWRSTSRARLSPEPVPPAVTLTPRPVPPNPRPEHIPRPCEKTVVASGLPLLIDDLEDQNARVLLDDGRSGAWSLFSDGTGRVTPEPGGVLHPTPIPGGRGDSRYALHVSGARLSEWGININTELSPRHCYDASVHAGVQFWARGKGRLLVGARMVDVVEVKFGGHCKESCYNVHNRAVDVGPTWARHAVRWDELEQAREDGRLEFDARRLVSVDFGVFAADTPFDVWIDDIEFLPR